MSSGDRLLDPGVTCWRVERADRFAWIVDGADYFRHCKAAMLRAHHRITLIGWDFDTRIALERGGKTLPGPNQLGVFLSWMLWKRPALEIVLLKSNLRLLSVFDDIWYGTIPTSVLNRLSTKRIHFAVDGAHPTGSVHHQKIVVVDDKLAFCGGIDLTMDRWDTREHSNENRLRRGLGRGYGPRHEVAVVVDGAAAAALAELARERWRTATGRSLRPVKADHTVWPSGVEPVLCDIEIGIARTLPQLAGRGEVREVEALNVAAISAARDIIYLENQYLASRALAEELARRLRDPEGPEIVMVLPRRSESRLEKQSMDSARYRLLQMLWAADSHQRLGVYWPVTAAGKPIYVHSKVLLVDDRLLRVGSSNLNNRSMGFDSECDLAVEADPSAREHLTIRQKIASLRNQLLGEHLGVSGKYFERVVQQRGSVLAAIEALRGEGRTLRRFTERTVADESSLLAENDLMDPDRVPRSLTGSVQRWLEGFTRH
ncbi:MAG: phospholipase D-like domain-containing protein [Mycolicibacterium sp.]|uniref:phospholipase D-like domain-containing protein n=1 Tax=Mycolicibacterium sp. TaxID=2320850 RepID=UPI003D136F53